MSMDHDYARGKLELLLRDLTRYTGDEFWRQMSRIASGATGKAHAEDHLDHLSAISETLGEGDDIGAAHESVVGLLHQLKAERERADALAAHVKWLRQRLGICRHHACYTIGGSGALALQMTTVRKVADEALREEPVTSLAHLIAEKQAEGMESLVPKVADGVGRSLSLSDDDIITLEEWIGDLAEVHRETGESAK